MNPILPRTALAVCLAAPAAFSTTVYNAAADFAPASNPAGPWSFGTVSPALNSPFSLATSSGTVLGVDYWSDPAPGALTAMHNPTASTIVYGTVNVDPGQLILHPASMGQYAVARFTAPVSGIYTFSAEFIGQDFILGTTSDVHLLKNGSSLFSSAVNGYHATASSGVYTMPLTIGDTLDAAVGFGGNGNFFGDSTGLDFNVELVPTPGPLALLSIGGIVAVRRRR